MRKPQNKRTLYGERLAFVQVFCKFAVLAIGFFFLSYTLISCSNENSPRSADSNNPGLPAPVSETDTIISLTNALQNSDTLAKFTHSNQYHAQLSCLACHRRDDNSPKIVFPGKGGHTPCIGCHTQQFADNKSLICTICHTDSETGSQKPFPPLRTFGVKFDHARHMQSANCEDCHQPSQGGIAKSIPAGSNAHQTCFKCHSADAGHDLSTCSVCHEPGQRPGAPSESAEAFGRNFSHANHNFNCTDCHSIKAGGARGNQVASLIAVSMHSQSGSGQSCATCHNERRAFGAGDFSDCRRCHQQFAATKSFGVAFPHSAHAKTSCAVCHKATGKGVGFSIPAGQNAHANCFQCHSPVKQAASANKSYCFACHQAGKLGGFSVPPQKIAGNFSHSKHKGLNCSACHNSQGQGISAPVVAMHKAPKGARSCASCHNDLKAFGGDDFSDCKRCHLQDNFKF